MSMTFQLFTVLPSFVGGVSRVLDLGATHAVRSYNLRETPEEADAAALWSDWVMVGRDMQAALNRLPNDTDGQAA